MTYLYYKGNDNPEEKNPIHILLPLRAIHNIYKTKIRGQSFDDELRKSTLPFHGKIIQYNKKNKTLVVDEKQATKELEVLLFSQTYLEKDKFDPESTQK